MEKIKKFAKEISVFGIVIIVVLALIVYKQFNPTNYTFINSQEAVSMFQSGEDFIVVFGTDTPTTTSSSSSTEQSSDPANLTAEQTAHVRQYIKDHRQKVYYVDTDEIEDLSTYFSDNFQTSSISLPQTLFIKNGEIKLSKEGTIRYTEFGDLVNEWKNM